MSGFWKTLKTFKISFNMQMSIYFYTLIILITPEQNIGTFDFLQEEDELVFITFWQTVFKLPFQYLQNIVILCFQFVKFIWEKYNVLGADEDGQWLFLHNKFSCFCYIFSNVNGIEKPGIQFNNKKHLLQFKVKCND